MVRSKSILHRVVLILATTPACGLEIWGAEGIESWGQTEGDADKTFHFEHVVGYASTVECQQNMQPPNQYPAFFNKIKQFGWHGIHESNAARPNDFADDAVALPTGADLLKADAATLAIYYGHGNHNLLSWTNKAEDAAPANVCDLDVARDVRLRKLGGDKARIAIWMASCVGYTDFSNPLNTMIYTLGASDALQQMGFFDSPSVSPNLLADFVDKLGPGIAGAPGVLGNSERWLEAFTWNNDIHNQPVVFTFKLALDGFDEFPDRIEYANLLSLSHLPAEPQQLVENEYFAWYHGNDECPECPQHQVEPTLEPICEPELILNEPPQG
jgi:hypothetical protein